MLTAMRWIPALGMVCGVLVGVGGAAAPGQPVKHNMQPTPKPEFSPGPPVTPTRPLMDWLKVQGEQKPPRLVRIPVTLEQGTLGISHALLGDTSIAVSDLGLGIGLADRVRHACGKASSCTLWLIGYWRSSTALDLRDTGGVVDPAETPRAWLEKTRSP
jgi:hypothetical protein